MRTILQLFIKYMTFPIFQQRLLAAPAPKASCCISAIYFKKIKQYSQLLHTLILKKKKKRSKCSQGHMANLLSWSALATAGC